MGQGERLGPFFCTEFGKALGIKYNAAVDLRVYVGRRFLKTLTIAFIEIIGIPSAIIGGIYLLGFKIDPVLADWAADRVQPYGPLLVILIILGVAWLTCYKVVKEDRENYERNFYNANSQARIEKAHLVFFRLYLKGRLVKNGVPEQRQDWDKEVLEAMRQYCNTGAISVYLSNTGRYAPGTDFHPLPDTDFDYALGFVWDRLSDEFKNFFK